MQLFVASASFRPTQDIDHPLNPMRGYTGQEGGQTRADEEDDEDDDENAYGIDTRSKTLNSPPPYDLIYILDAIYYFPPSVPYYLASVLPSLRPGTGVLAFTDVLPPSSVSNVMGQLVLPMLLSVPARNIVNRPSTLEEYKELLERIGYVDVQIEDWSEHVWDGFADDLAKRGFAWSQVAKVIRGAKTSGWRFVAVRGRKPEDKPL